MATKSYQHITLADGLRIQDPEQDTFIRFDADSSTYTGKDLAIGSKQGVHVLLDTNNDGSTSTSAGLTVRQGADTIDASTEIFHLRPNGDVEVSGAFTATGDITTTNGTVTMDRLALSSSQTTVSPLQLTASSLNDGVGALRIDSVEPDIYLNDTNGGFSTVTFANNDVQRAAFGRNSNDDFYITVRDPAVNSGNWKDDSLVVDSSSGNISMGYDLSIDNLTIRSGDNGAPANNGELSFEVVDNTTVRIHLRGTDGTARSVDLTLS